MVLMFISFYYLQWHLSIIKFNINFIFRVNFNARILFKRMCIRNGQQTACRNCLLIQISVDYCFWPITVVKQSQEYIRCYSWTTSFRKNKYLIGDWYSIQRMSLFLNSSSFSINKSQKSYWYICNKGFTTYLPFSLRFKSFSLDFKFSCL